MKNPKRPLVAQSGDAKVSSKLEALENMFKLVDKLIIKDAMAINRKRRLDNFISSLSVKVIDLLNTFLFSCFFYKATQ
ncbi:MAG: phosphoglycerate kinase [Desulfobacteraceae bacterium]|nr:phosphoglycerate kinase [Desulfobacteraceae bacterium]